MESALLRCVYSVAGVLADSVMILFPCSRPNLPPAPSDVDDLSDAQIDELHGKGIVLSEEPGADILGDNRIWRITDRTVYKANLSNVHTSSEILTLDFVHRHTTIPVPRVHRIIRDEDALTVGFVMDYIPGRQLRVVWPSLSIFGKLRVACTLRHYIGQLRAIRSPRSAIPGPIGEGDEARECVHQLFGRINPCRGPFLTYAALSEWSDSKTVLEHRERARYAGKEVDKGKIEPFDNSAPLVLTHGDINTRNVLVGDDGQLWLIDWGFSGFYPRWFEFVALREACEEDEDMPRDWVWRLLVPFICGPFFHQEKWWQFMCPVLDRYPGGY